VPIQFACPYCETISSVPDSFAGKQGKCPACQKVIEVPDPAAGTDDPRDVREPVDPNPAGSTVGGPVGGSSSGSSPSRPSPSRGRDTKECKFCGETIKSVAKKCKFCGEFFDKSTQPRRAGGDREKKRRAEESPGVIDYLLSVFCGLIGCIVAIVYLIQGYHKKGLIMIGVSFIAQFFWGFLQIMISQMR
jgi:hypothetical protein